MGQVEKTGWKGSRRNSRQAGQGAARGSSRGEAENWVHPAPLHPVRDYKQCWRSPYHFWNIPGPAAACPPRRRLPLAPERLILVGGCDLSQVPGGGQVGAAVLQVRPSPSLLLQREKTRKLGNTAGAPGSHRTGGWGSVLPPHQWLILLLTNGTSPCFLCPSHTRSCVGNAPVPSPTPSARAAA